MPKSPITVAKMDGELEFDPGCGDVSAILGTDMEAQGGERFKTWMCPTTVHTDSPQDQSVWIGFACVS